MSVNLKSVQSCLDSIGFFLSIADVALLPDKKLIAVGWYHTDGEGLETWISFNVLQSKRDTMFDYRFNHPWKLKDIRHVVKNLRDTANSVFYTQGAKNFKVLYEGISGWQDVNFEIDPSWKVIKLLPLSTN